MRHLQRHKTTAHPTHRALRAPRGRAKPARTRTEQATARRQTTAPPTSPTKQTAPRNRANPPRTGETKRPSPSQPAARRVSAETHVTRQPGRDLLVDLLCQREL